DHVQVGGDRVVGASAVVVDTRGELGASDDAAQLGRLVDVEAVVVTSLRSRPVTPRATRVRGAGRTRDAPHHAGSGAVSARSAVAAHLAVVRDAQTRCGAGRARTGDARGRADGAGVAVAGPAMARGGAGRADPAAQLVDLVDVQAGAAARAVRVH